MRGARQRGLLVLLFLVGWWLACAPLRVPPPPPPPLSIQELADQGDATRRASMRLVVRGLDADDAGRLANARADYERALQLDPSNPYAYLALARHLSVGTDPERALPYLDKAQALFDVEANSSPRVEAHLVGLRGVALRNTGRSAEAVPSLERARELDPVVWSDGDLSAAELR